MKILAMLSGGMDSTALCYYLLALHPVAHDIHIHHARFGYVVPTQREKARAEQLATENVISWLRDHCRPFEYSESDIEMPAPEWARHNDHLWVAMIGASLINVTRRHAMATARIATDNKYRGMKDILETFNLLVGGEKGMGRTRIKRDTRDVLEWEPVHWVTPIETWTKAESLSRIPHDLLDLTTSCQRPLVMDNAIEGCGTCRTCKRLQQARKCIADGMTVESANEWLSLNAPSGIETLAPKERFVWPITLEEVERMEKAGELYR